MTDHWELLGADPGAPLRDVKRAAREALRRAHPDHGGSSEEFHRAHDAAVRCLLEATTADDGSPADVDGWPLELVDPEPRPSFWHRRVEPVLDSCFAVAAIVGWLGFGYVVALATVTLAAMALQAVLVPLLRALTPN